MSKFEANFSLFIITFFASVQYVFLARVPSDLSHFAFLWITNLIGFLMTFAFFFGELFRLDLNQIKQSAVLALELVAFNLFMLMGVKEIDAAVTSAVLSSYFIFILLFDSVYNSRVPTIFNVTSVILVFSGLFFMMDADIKGLYNIHILYLLIADVFFALYVITVGKYSSSSNPSILAMGQMFFCFLFSLILWFAENVFTGINLELPKSQEFWVSVIFISFFIRGLYGIIQIYAQRYVSALNTSLIFSSEVIMTMLISPLLADISGIEPQKFTPFRIAGSILIISGLVIMEPDFLNVLEKIIKRLFRIGRRSRISQDETDKITLSEKVFLIFVTGCVYILMDLPVHNMSVYANLNSFLPSIAGLFFGPYGITGMCLGCIISSLILDLPFYEVLTECRCIITAGMCMHYGWHLFSKSHRVLFKHFTHYSRYSFITVLASILCFNWDYSLSFLISSIIIGLPVNIFFSSILYIKPVVPFGYKNHFDSVFDLEQGAENLETANEIIQDEASKKHITMKRIFEVQSCLEEISLRIFNVMPDAKIRARLIYYNSISLWLDYEYNGEKYNPFRTGKYESEEDLIGVNIIKHRALRASYIFFEGVNKIHVVL